MNKIQMLATLERKTFRAKQFDELLKLLREQDTHTVRATINDPADLLLDEKGRLQSNGFALSPLAFRQICVSVARGLWSLAADISGVAVNERTYDSTISVPLAARIVNDCIRLRFQALDGLMGRDMVQDHLSKVIDGVVGPRYQLLPNYQLLEAVEDMLSGHDVPMTFHEAELYGRRLSLIYTTDKPLANSSAGPVYGGAYFSNSEAGECAVSGSTVLQFGKTLRCTNKMCRLIHAGTDFVGRLRRMMGDVLNTWDVTVRTGVGAEARMQQSLNLVDASQPSHSVDSRKRARLKALFAEHVDKRIANSVVRHIIYAGADGTDVPRFTPVEEIQRRKIRDVAITAMKIARGNYPEIREGLERIAFEALAGTLKI